MEDKLVKILVERYEKKGCLTVEELVIPRQLHSKAFKRNSKRSYRRIDLAVYDPERKLVIFIEAENGLWMQHPVAYKELANYTYLASPVEEKKREFNGEQKDWAKKEGIGIIEIDLLTKQVNETVKPQFVDLEKSIIELIYYRMKKAKEKRK
ncbi:MAG: hypothetical protein ACTSYA_13510 [Candidatus Kariarchaeaceae archaeon]